MDSTVLLEKDNAIAFVTLNNIAKHNAFDDNMIALLTRQFEALAKCQTTRAIVLKAAGKHFCAGADLAWMKRMKAYSQAENQRDSLALAQLLKLIYQHPKPVIACVQGSAYGGGVGLIAACDFAVASASSTFCFSEVKLGLIPAVISPYVIKAIGERLTKQLFLTAETFNAAQAQSHQLIQVVCQEDSLLASTTQLAKKITRNGPNAINACKQLINDITPITLNSQLLEHTSERIATLRVSSEGQEGLSAFFEKRSPNWN